MTNPGQSGTIFNTMPWKAYRIGKGKRTVFLQEGQRVHWPSLVERFRQLDEAEDLKRNFEVMDGQDDAGQEARKKFKAELQTLSAEEKEERLMARIQHLEAQNSKLFSENSGLQNQMHVTASSYRQEVRELRAQIFDSDEDLDELLYDWKHLRRLVEKFVLRHTKGAFDSEKLQAVQKSGRFKVVEKLVADAQAALQCKFIFSPLIEAAVWRFLDSHIFGPQGQFWCGALGQKFGTLYQEVSGKFSQLRDKPDRVLCLDSRTSMLTFVEL